MDCDDWRRSWDLRLFGDVGAEAGGDWGAGSKPEWDIPSSQIGSGQRSGVASLSSRYLMALSRWPFPCLATVRSALDPLRDGEFAAWEGECDWASICGSDRSVLDALNVCENHPDSRVGRSVIRGFSEPW